MSSKETVKVIDLGSDEEVNDDVSPIYKTVDSHKLKGNKYGVTMDSEQNINNNEKEDSSLNSEQKSEITSQKTTNIARG